MQVAFLFWGILIRDDLYSLTYSTYLCVLVKERIRISGNLPAEGL